MRDNVSDAVGEALRAVLLFLPKAVGFVAILVAGWLIAKAVLKIVGAVLERVGFDRAVERGGIKTALSRSRYDASDIVAKLAYYALLLVTLQLAFGIWGPNPVSELIAGVVAWLPRAFVAIVIVVVAAAIAHAVKDIISGALGGLSYGRVLANVASVFIIGLGVIAALDQVGVATAVTTPVLVAVLATIGGILVVGVGGGLVRPMQSRWESWLSRAERESRTIATHARAYQAQRRESAREAAEKAAATAPPADDADRTQVVTQVVPRPAEETAVVAADQSQVVPSGADRGLVTATGADAGRTPVVADADADRTQVVPTVGATDGDADRTQVVPRATPAGDDVDRTQIVPAAADGDDADRTQVVSRPEDATMVIPRPGGDASAR